MFSLYNFAYVQPSVLLCKTDHSFSHSDMFFSSCIFLYCIRNRGWWKKAMCKLFTDELLLVRRVYFSPFFFSVFLLFWLSLLVLLWSYFAHLSLSISLSRCRCRIHLISMQRPFTRICSLKMYFISFHSIFRSFLIRLRIIYFVTASNCVESVFWCVVLFVLRVLTSEHNVSSLFSFFFLQAMVFHCVSEFAIIVARCLR